MIRFCVAFCLLAFVEASAVAAEAPQTVSDYTVALDAIARRLDLQVHDRQGAGAVAAAQRVALASAMVRRSGAEFRDAEQNALTDGVDTLPAPVKAAIDAAFARAQEAETRAADDPRFIDEAHATFNALIDALPVRTPHPTFYGLLSNDLTDPAGRLDADVVIYGDRMIDPVNATAPTVAYAGEKLPVEAVKTSADRLKVNLPAAMKTAIRFAPPPCGERAAFGLRVHSVYALKHGFWPIAWHTSVDTSEDVFALASAVVFEAKITGVLEAEATEASIVPFRQLSDFAVADCEETKAVEVKFATPEGAKDVVCQAAWINAFGGATTIGSCENRNGALSASGALTGSVRICSPDKTCACRETAHGFLQISGSYRVSRSASAYTPLPAPAPLVFPRGSLAEATLGEEKLRQLKIEISRRECGKVTDSMTMDLGPEADASARAVSSSTAFRADFANGRLRVGSDTAFAP